MALVAVPTVASVVGCATPQPVPSDRRGLIDILSALDSPDRSETSRPEATSYDLREIQKMAASWQLPLANVEINSPYGRRGNKFHDGLDLKAGVGTPVYAVGEGVVAYSGNKIHGYGRMIVIDHGNEIYTVYAHHHKNFKKLGDHVQKGDRIALSGRSGRVSGPHLHFEVRKGSLPVNPLDVLPVSDRVIASSKKSE